MKVLTLEGQTIDEVLHIDPDVVVAFVPDVAIREHGLALLSEKYHYKTLVIGPVDSSDYSSTETPRFFVTTKLHWHRAVSLLENKGRVWLSDDVVINSLIEELHNTEVEALDGTI